MLDCQYAPHVINSSGTDTGRSAVDFGAYGHDQLNARPLGPLWPPPPPVQQPFSDDCYNISQFLSDFVDPNFSNYDHYNFNAPTQALSLNPRHTTEWNVLAHAMHTGDQEPLMDTMDTLARTFVLQSDLMEPTMSNSFQANDPEVLAAASTLSRTTAMGPSMSFPHGAMATDFSPADHMPPGSHSTPRHDAGFPHVLGLSRPGPPFPLAPSRRVEAHYGTDTSFNQPQYQPRSNQDSLHDIDSRHMAILSCLTRNESAAPSRVPSPVDQGRHGPASGPPALFLQTDPSSARRREAYGDEDEEPRGKRRKSSPVRVESPAGEAAVGGVLAERSPMLPTETQQRRRQSSAQATKTGTPSTSKRKRASTTVPKKNLTETERRANHIESEARRRNQVTDAFASLRTLVPGIEKSKGLSRNTVLTSIGDWVADLKATNERLEALLAGPSPPPPP